MKTLKEITDSLEIWIDWKNSYNNYVPKFIEEAIKKKNWQDWDQEIFQEFFEKGRDQCVSSLRQGYFSNVEKNNIKKDWDTIGNLLQQVALVQDRLQLDVYHKLAKAILKHTSQNRVAATNRLIASLQPQLLCTVVNNRKLDALLSHLSTKIIGCDFQKKGNWYEKSHAVLDFFKSELDLPAQEIMTLPWQVYDYFNPEVFNESNEMSEPNEDLNEKLSLLEFKKQIILQGPPGTGKTKMAKELAREMVVPKEISTEEIKMFLKPNTIISNLELNAIFKIKEVYEDKIQYVRLSDNTGFFDEIKIIKDAFQKRLWVKKKHLQNNLNYKDYIAKYLYEVFENSGQLQIIQFHPSFTYEDFVRGMTVRSAADGTGLVYETENKVFGKIIKEAHRNLLDSNKDVETLSYENWIESVFDTFIDHIRVQLNASKSLPITENINLVSIEEDALRYKGKTGWSKLGNRMLFEDIIQAIVDNNQSRQDIKKNTKLSGLAKWHASYYIRVVDLFYDFIREQNLEYKRTVMSKVQRKNYVLIIDEINRANLSSVLGELIYALEYRNEGVGSIYNTSDQDLLIIPENLFIIGTMNTADRSVSQIDYAIRRRFAFVDVLPVDLSDELNEKFSSSLFQKVQALFKNIENKKSDYLTEEFKPEHVQLGHSYFIHDEKEGGTMAVRWKYEIKPILKEYIKDGILKDSVLGAIDEIEEEFNLI